MAVETHETRNSKIDVKEKLPAWRRIEALKERRRLKEALADIWADDPELDEDFFALDGGGSSTHYQKAGSAEVDSDLDNEEFD